ncbi:uncharacterized protein LOC114259500 [Camellia sinensis]|uniref:uncharacterized protein LOC114259500 n=1 Tax=Camellia sinensis TaxID=4442 RepID=UPI00103670D6|nr:uncharacterized protein LOC114259500 [Camellia sinensis]
MGTISMKIMVASSEPKAEFHVMDVPATFNMLLRRPWLHQMNTVLSTMHQSVKYLDKMGIAIVFGCLSINSQLEVMTPLLEIWHGEDDVFLSRFTLAEAQLVYEEEWVDPGMDIGQDQDSDLSGSIKEALEITLANFLIDYGTIAEKMNLRDSVVIFVIEGGLPVELYPTWLANIVSVPKKNGRIKVCADFRDLNKDSLKDDFPLPHIDELVDFTVIHCYRSWIIFQAAARF